MMEINLNIYWDSPDADRQKEVALELVNALISTGHSQEYAIALVQSFHAMATRNGEFEEAFNNCGANQ